MKVDLIKAPREDKPSAMLFHRDSFIFRKPGAGVFSYQEGDTYIRMPVCFEENTLTSLSKSPFGGFDMSENIDQELLEAFMHEVLKHSENRDITRFWVRTYPEIYNLHDWAMIDRILLNVGFKLQYSDVNLHLSTSIHFLKNLQPSEKRYLNLAHKEQWAFEKLDPAKDLKSAYDILLQSRTLKKYPISMTCEELKEMFTLFPEEYLLFGVRCQGELLAVAICICINDRIIYDFMHGDAIHFRKKSPVVFLLSGIHSYAENHHKNLIDLGICSHKGIRNEGLCTFKKNMGGEISEKRAYLMVR